MLPTTEQVLAYVTEHPGCKSKQIAQHFGCTSRDINRQRDGYLGIYSIPGIRHDNYLHYPIQAEPDSDQTDTVSRQDYEAITDAYEELRCEVESLKEANEELECQVEALRDTNEDLRRQIEALKQQLEARIPKRIAAKLKTPLTAPKAKAETEEDSEAEEDSEPGED